MSAPGGERFNSLVGVKRHLGIHVPPRKTGAKTSGAKGHVLGGGGGGGDAENGGQGNAGAAGGEKARKQPRKKARGGGGLWGRGAWVSSDEDDEDEDEDDGHVAWARANARGVHELDDDEHDDGKGEYEFPFMYEHSPDGAARLSPGAHAIAHAPATGLAVVAGDDDATDVESEPSSRTGVRVEAGIFIEDLD